ncbi:MAG: RagB/SusD family nutrient uptake outer membrane protein [Candidatus Pseudobacter hemicellulosilyticus]|uniref:RagB/SusD family nutrient uptake outer membrane protein n=1 Tax=Candidatus Pseudobacter hemicellulosilyticus TaxID=3121375 RepID=A0AAJ5WZY0_9BACT|nr:MAG: RagB/SusD family nutrient uptake outer membrane protein [Pseudobacter sp.]
MKHILFLIFFMALFSACKKSFLDKKPNNNLSIPNTLASLQAMLDNQDIMKSGPSLGELSTDDYQMDYTEWNNQSSVYTRNLYVWAPDIFEGTIDDYVKDYKVPYTAILTANIVLDQLGTIQRTTENQTEWDKIKGSALFLRAFIEHQLAEVFALPYDESADSSVLGIVLRRTSNVNVSSVRATLVNTYKQILQDAQEAANLMPEEFPARNLNRGSKVAALALVARVNLAMRRYEAAGLAADQALSIKSSLIDYNTLDTTVAMPFTRYNVENIFYAQMVDCDPLIYVSYSTGYSVDTLLYRSYAKNDLRKSLFYQWNGNYINRKRFYSEAITFNGLATDELYLIRAESFARAGNLSAAMNDLNALMQTRWVHGTFVPYTAASAVEALSLILMERRKELTGRGIRWSDIRRLNKEGYNITLKRVLNGKEYLLPPNDRRYALPFPPEVLVQSGIQQNIR